MQLKKECYCDVLVIGSGIAGISAALEAAETGKKVVLCCKGNLFSGSSFYPGTWGLGLIGPEKEEDQADLEQSICQIGCGMADPKLVSTFVQNIHPSIEWMREMGVRLRRARQGQQKEFIPCFDHKHRDWNGIEFDSAREIFAGELKRLQVIVLPGYEALQLVKAEDAVCGAIFYGDGSLHYIAGKAVVLASGGYGSLFRYHLCTYDVLGIGQYLALDAGCSLVNMEFMQMMPGYLTPAPKTIFNEKTFRFTQMYRPDGTELLSSQEQDLLAMRSTHGPFTSRLDSKAIDIALFDQFQRDSRGVRVVYQREMIENPPEFIRVYFDWLKKIKKIAITDAVWIGIFAHAANGGVWIHPDASTEVSGLFAAGEVTGGMHGADRIGGLSTANGLVFGRIAGKSAAEYEGKRAPDSVSLDGISGFGGKEILEALQDRMFRNAMVLRHETGLNETRNRIRIWKQKLWQSAVSSVDARNVAQWYRLFAMCTTAESILGAAALRAESRGSHYRTDFPQQDERFQKRIRVRMDSQEVHCDYEKEEKA